MPPKAKPPIAPSTYKRGATKPSSIAQTSLRILVLSLVVLLTALAASFYLNPSHFLSRLKLDGRVPPGALTALHTKTLQPDATHTPSDAGVAHTADAASTPAVPPATPSDVSEPPLAAQSTLSTAASPADSSAPDAPSPREAVQDAGPRLPWGNLIAGNIRLLPWSPERGLRQIYTRNLPAALQHTVASTWPALSKWTPEYLSQAASGDVSISVQTPPENVFVYHNANLPMSSLPAGKRQRQSSRTVDGTLADVWKLCREGENAYFSGPLELFEALKSDVSPVAPFMEPSTKGRDVNLWLGCKGVVAQTHYDATFNFFTQIYGRKKFILTPPSAFHRLYLYPRLHPSYRQSQVDFDVENRTAFPLFMAAAPRPGEPSQHQPASFAEEGPASMEITLSPGDVLFVPPFWFHRVVALDDSISVSIWTDSNALDAVDQLSRVSIPLDTHWDAHLLHRVLQSLVKKVVRLFEKARQLPPNEVFRSLVASRYFPLFGKRDCSEESVRAYCGTSFEDVRMQYDGLPADLPSKVVKYVNQVGEAIAGLFEDGDGDSGVLLFQNYIEQLVHSVIPIERVNDFLQCCVLSMAVDEA